MSDSTLLYPTLSVFINSISYHPNMAYVDHNCTQCFHQQYSTIMATYETILLTHLGSLYGEVII